MSSHNSKAYQVLNDDPRYRFCNDSYVNERDLLLETPPPPLEEAKPAKPATPAKLLRCSRCCEVFYKDAASQRRHWPLHKQSCKKLEDDADRVRHGRGYESLDECLETLSYILERPKERIKGRELLYAFQQLWGLLGAASRDTHFLVESDFKIRKLKSSLIRYIGNFRHLSLEDLEVIWGIPGFCSYFLNDFVLISKRNRERQEAGEIPPGQRLFDTEEDLDDAVLEGKLDPEEIVAPTYYGITMSLFFTSCMEDHGIMRRSALAAGIARTIFNSWCSPYSRSSIPSVTSSADENHWERRLDSYTVTLLATLSRFDGGDFPLGEWTRPEELAPGLLVKDFFLAAFAEKKLFEEVSNEELIGGLMRNILHPNGDTRWNHLSALDRIDLLNALALWEPPEVLEFVYETYPIKKGTGQYPPAFDSSIFKLMVANVIQSSSSCILLETYAALSSSSPHPDTAAYIRRNRNLLLDQQRPSTLAIVEILEMKYQQCNPQKPLSFPQELVELVTEYAVSEDRGNVSESKNYFYPGGKRTIFNPDQDYEVVD